MSLNFTFEPIKKVGRDTYALDFAKANKFGIELYNEGSDPIENSSVTVSNDGTLYLNTKHKHYQLMKEIYEMFDDASTENLIMLYKMYDSKCPDVRKVEDIDKCTGKAKGDAIIKMMLKYELKRREYKSARVQPLLNMLVHGEND